MHIIGCGGRTLFVAPASRRYTWLQQALRHLGVTEVVEGGARGADAGFSLVAREIGIDTVRFWPNWVRFAQGAGPRRNAKQLRYLRWSATTTGEPCAVVALPGGSGTADMVRQAREAGVHIFTIPRDVLDGPAPQNAEEVYCYADILSR